MPVSPGTSSLTSAGAAPKANRLVFKHTPASTPVAAVSPQPDDYGGWPSLASTVADPRSYQHIPAPIEHTAPPVKRRKELEYDEYGGDSTTSSSTVRKKNWVPLRKMLNNALKKLIDLDGYKFFYEPVSEKDAPGYFAVIKRPMDFSTMRRKMLEDKYPFWSLFVEDFETICQNCITYNLPNSIYWNEAKTLLLEGKKYLKVQATKINPELLQQPENFNSAANANAKGDSGAPHSNLVLEKPKRLYIRNEDLPRELISAPPPVHFAKNSDYTGPTYIPQDTTVAKSTPQQQTIAESSDWTGFTVTPAVPSTHWKRSIPSYIAYTRGFAAPDANPTPRERKIRSRDSHSSASSTYENPAHASYTKAITKLNGAVDDTAILDTLLKEDRNRFEALSRILLPDADSEPVYTFDGVDAASMEVDASSLPGNPGLLLATPETLNDIRDLWSTLSGSQIDLAFLDKLFVTEDSANAASSGLLERSSELVQLLQVSTLQRRTLDTAFSSNDANHLVELSANLATMASQMPSNTLGLNAASASRLRNAVDAGIIASHAR